MTNTKEPPKGAQSNTGLQVVGSSSGSKTGTDYDHFFKILVIGDLDVGKTSLILRYTGGNFVEDTKAFSRMDFEHKMVKVVKDKKTLTCKLQIWDTAGQEKFRTMTVSTFKGSKAVLIGYDVSSKKSFEDVLVWIRETERFMGGEEPLIILFGNKTDLDRQVSKEQVERFCAGKYQNFDISVKNNEGVDELFNATLDHLLSANKLQ